MTGEKKKFQSEFNQIPNRSENERRKEKISQFYTKKFTQSLVKRQEKMHNFKVNPEKFDWRSKSKWKWKKKQHLKEKIWQIDTILGEKIHWIRFEMTRENAV